MRSRAFLGLAVITLCAWAAAAEPPGPFSMSEVLICAAEPNAPAPDPNQPRDPAPRLTATWESISASMTLQLYNPTVAPDQKAKEPQYALSLASRLTVADSNGLVGLSLTTGSAQAFDQEGRRVASTAPADPEPRSYIRPYQSALITSLAGGCRPVPRPRTFPVSLPLDANLPYPSWLSRVEWSMYALVSDEMKIVDIPFQANDTWVELAPGMKIRVEAATAAPGQYEYTVRAEWDSRQADYLSGGTVNLWGSQKPLTALMVDTDVLDATGKPFPTYAAACPGSYVISYGLGSGSGTCWAYYYGSGTPTTIRFILAFNSYEKEVRLVLENVPVPLF